MYRALAQNRRESVVVGVFVILDRADAAPELIGAAVVNVSYGTAGQWRIVIEIAVKVNCVRAEVLQFHAGASPQLLSPGQVPLIELLGRQVRAHGDGAHVGSGNARNGRTCAGAWRGTGKQQQAAGVPVLENRGGEGIFLCRRGISMELVGFPVEAKPATKDTCFR